MNTEALFARSGPFKVRSLSSVQRDEAIRLDGEYSGDLLQLREWLRTTLGPYEWTDTGSYKTWRSEDGETWERKA